LVEGIGVVLVGVALGAAAVVVVVMVVVGADLVGGGSSAPVCIASIIDSSISQLSTPILDIARGGGTSAPSEGSVAVMVAVAAGVAADEAMFPPVRLLTMSAYLQEGGAMRCCRKSVVLSTRHDMT
jgi:hypothetical protein